MRGAELSAAVRPVAALFLRGAYGYLDAEDRSPSRLGVTLQYRPTHQVTAETRWEARFGLSAAVNVQVTALLGAGLLASILTNVLRLRLGIPGSNIVFVAFPLALGFALVPRRGAGFVMAGGALVANAALWLLGVRLDGFGAQTSLLATGPLLDLALRRFAGGWRLYLAFVGACATSNALAFLVRGVARAGGMRGTGGGGGRTFAAWWPHAVWTYAVAGIVAGSIAVVAWFQIRERAK